MPKSLSFKVPGRTKSEVTQIGDELTGIIEIPRYGCVTPGEEIAIADYYLNLERQSVSELKLDMATLLLSSRHDRDWTREDTEREIENFHLIELLYEFLMAERRRHTPESQLLRVEGVDARQIAFDFAKYQNAVLASRADFKAQNIWFVFKGGEQPADFDIEVNFSETREPEALAVGKSSQKSTGKNSASSAA